MLRYLPLLVLVAVAPVAESAPTYPIVVWGEYCWTPDSCRPDVLRLHEDHSFNSREGSRGTWATTGGATELVLLFETSTVYWGAVVGGGCVEGEMLGYTGITGTWWGCV